MTAVRRLVAGDGADTPVVFGQVDQVGSSSTVPTPPATTLDQRHAALATANKVREHRATVKRILRTLPTDMGEAAVAFILQVPDPLELTWRIRDVLHSIRWYGDRRVTQILIATKTSPTRTVGGLSTRQRSEIIEHLRGGS